MLIAEEEPQASSPRQKLLTYIFKSKVNSATFEKVASTTAKFKNSSVDSLSNHFFFQVTSTRRHLKSIVSMKNKCNVEQATKTINQVNCRLLSDI